MRMGNSIWLSFKTSKLLIRHCQMRQIQKCAKWKQQKCYEEEGGMLHLKRVRAYHAASMFKYYGGEMKHINIWMRLLKTLQSNELVREMKTNRLHRDGNAKSYECFASFYLLLLVEFMSPGWAMKFCNKMQQKLLQLGKLLYWHNFSSLIRALNSFFGRTSWRDRLGYGFVLLLN